MSTYKPRISIGLPVYNGARFIEETLNSILAQTYSDFELIISDNASTDQTEVICRAYAAKDRRIRYYRNHKNLGLGRNYSRVFELATGEYFKWAASDDLCKPDHLARCLAVLDMDSTVVLAYPKSRFIDETGKLLDVNDPGWDLRSEDAYERFRYVIYAGHWVNAIYGLIRRHVLSKTRLMPSYPGGDYRLLGEISLAGKLFEIPEYLHLRRLHPGASSQNTTNLPWMLELHKGKRGYVCLPLWQLSADHLMSIIRSELSIAQKLSLVGSLLRHMRWEQQQLLEELAFAFKTYLSGLARKS